MMDMNVKMNKMMDIVEEKMPENGRVCIHMLLNDGHHDEYTATARSERWFLSHTLASHLNHMT